MVEFPQEHSIGHARQDMCGVDEHHGRLLCCRLCLFFGSSRTFQAFVSSILTIGLLEPQMIGVDTDLGSELYKACWSPFTLICAIVGSTK